MCDLEQVSSSATLVILIDEESEMQSSYISCPSLTDKKWYIRDQNPDFEVKIQMISFQMRPVGSKFSLLGNPFMLPTIPATLSFKITGVLLPLPNTTTAVPSFVGDPKTGYQPG